MDIRAARLRRCPGTACSSSARATRRRSTRGWRRRSRRRDAGRGGGPRGYRQDGVAATTSGMRGRRGIRVARARERTGAGLRLRRRPPAARAGRRTADGAGADRPVEGAARPAASVLGAEDTRTGRVVRRLAWPVLEVVGLAGETPLVLCVDDVQWADWPSLRFLVHLAGRLESTSVRLILGLRTTEAITGDDLLDELRSTPGRAPSADAAVRRRSGRGGPPRTGRTSGRRVLLLPAATGRAAATRSIWVSCSGASRPAPSCHPTNRSNGWPACRAGVGHTTRPDPDRRARRGSDRARRERWRSSATAGGCVMPPRSRASRRRSARARPAGEGDPRRGGALRS